MNSREALAKTHSDEGNSDDEYDQWDHCFEDPVFGTVYSDEEYESRFGTYVIARMMDQLDPSEVQGGTKWDHADKFKQVLEVLPLAWKHQQKFGLMYNREMYWKRIDKDLRMRQRKNLNDLFRSGEESEE